MTRLVACLLLAAAAPSLCLAGAQRSLFGDNAAGQQVSAAQAAAEAAVPHAFDVTGNQLLSQAADNFLPKDFQDKVNAAMKNFQSGDKTVNPQIRDFAKMVAGNLMLQSEGDNNIANQSLGEILRMVIKHVFELAKVYIEAPEKVFTELPQNLTTAIGHSQPQNFLAWFADHEQQYKDLLSVVYKSGPCTDAEGNPTEGECDQPGTLTYPDSIIWSDTVINYAPCIVSNSPAGLTFGAQALNIIPSVFQAAPYGVNIQPQGINVQPALIYVFPSGFNVQPQGLNIGPALISVTPGGFAQVSKGGNVSPSLISVSVAQPPSRKLLK